MNYEEKALSIARRWACLPEDVDPMQRDIAAAIREAVEEDRKRTQPLIEQLRNLPRTRAS